MARIALFALMIAFTFGLAACSDQEGVYGEEEEAQENGGTFQQNGGGEDTGVAE